MGNGEVLSVWDKEEENAVLAAATAAAWYHQQWLARKKQAYRPPFEYVQHSFSLELMPPGRARIFLRFTPEEIRCLVPLLGLDGVAYRNRYTPDAETAFCVVAARLSFPNRWEHLCDLFGRSKSWLSTVFNDVILFLAARFGPLLWWHPQLTYNRMVAFSEAVHDAGGVEGVWGFVDGTFRGYCRPTGNEEQRRVYSGHKKLHGNNYQAIVTPDGLVSSLTGPFMGPTNDWTMWRRSGCEEAIREVSSLFFLYYLLTIFYLGYAGS
jgi:DDE superfamily endonuclease